MHAPSMVLHERGLRGDHEQICESCRHAYKAAHMSMVLCRKCAMGTCLMVAYCMSDDSGTGHVYLSACDHDDGTEAEEFFGMLS